MYGVEVKSRNRYASVLEKFIYVFLIYRVFGILNLFIYIILIQIDDEDEFFVFEDFILLNIDIIDFYFYDILFVVSLDSGDRINLKR